MPGSSEAPVSQQVELLGHPKEVRDNLPDSPPEAESRQGTDLMVVHPEWDPNAPDAEPQMRFGSIVEYKALEGSALMEKNDNPLDTDKYPADDSPVHPTAPQPPPPDDEEIYRSFEVFWPSIPPTSALPPVVESHSMVSQNGRFITFGGTNGSHMYCECWTFSLVTQRWRKLRTTGNIPLARYGHTASLHKGKMYVYGGFGLGGGLPGSGPHDPIMKLNGHQVSDSTALRNAEQGYQLIKCGLLNTMYCLDLESCVWTEISSTSSEYLKNHSAVMHDGRLYIFGGCSPKGRTNLVRVFDCETHAWLPTEYFNPQIMNTRGGVQAAVASVHIPAVRSGHTASLVVEGADANMVVFGGRMGKTIYSNETFLYNLASMTWQRFETCGTPPSPRTSHSAVTCHSHIIVFGGSSSTDGSDDHSPTKGARSGKTYFSDCYDLNMSTGVWREVELGQVITGRCGHTAVLFEDSRRRTIMAVFGGWGEVSITEVAGVTANNDPESAVFVPEKGVKYCTNNELIQFAIAPPAPPTPFKRHRVRSSRRRPSTARNRSTPDVRSASRCRSAASKSPSPRNASGSKMGMRTAHPWTVSTSKATTGRAFGECPAPPLRRRVTVSSSNMAGIVARLADTERSKLHREALFRQYVSQPVRQQMTPAQQQQFVMKHFFQATQTVAHNRERLEKKYMHEVEPVRLDAGKLQVMVDRLAVPPSRPVPHPPPRKPMRPSAEARTVNRLFYEGVKTSREKQQKLAQQYIHQSEAAKVDPANLTEIVDRLHHGISKPPEKKQPKDKKGQETPSFDPVSF